MRKGNPNIGNEGNKFTTENQPPPENKGRKPGARNRKKLLEAIISTRLSPDNLALVQLKKEFPEYFEENTEITIEDVMMLRAAREAIFSKRPIQAFKEILDRLDGKPTIRVERGDSTPVVDYEAREKKKREMLERSRRQKEQRENNGQ